MIVQLQVRYAHPSMSVKARKRARAGSARAERAPNARERLLEAAARLFLERGYHATGVAAVLESAGVHAGSLYHAFADKEALLCGVLEHYRRILRPVLIEPVEARESDPIERVFGLLAFYRHYLVDSDFRHGCPIGNLALELGDSIPAARARIEENFEAWTDAVAGWLAPARARFPSGTNLRALAGFVLTTMEGGLMLSRARRTIEPFDRAVARLREHFELLQAARGA
jgi:TetR/AcrR family transcriptional repressor of nem operon